MSSKSGLKRFIGISLELMLGVFLLGLVLIIWLPPGSDANAPEPARPPEAATNVLSVQGTPIVATINGSIDGTEPTFTGQRHFRSGIPGDRLCRLFGATGARSFDEVLFFNNSSATQRVIVQFTSGCGNNTYMAAFSFQFNPSNICENFIASPGLSGSRTWEFTVCNNSQFSIVVYGLEPGLICASYSYTVFGDGITLLGSSASVSTAGASQTVQGVEAGPFSEADVEIRKRKRKVRGTDTFVERVMPPGVVSSETALPLNGTPLVATINESIDGNDQTFAGPRHSGLGIPGDANCQTFPEIGTRFYDEFFFLNTSSSLQTIFVNFNPACRFSAFMAAYSSQFNPNNICENFIASTGVREPVNWQFTVCPNSAFSLVVYNVHPGELCADYSFSVFGNDILFLGTSADISVSKTAPKSFTAGSSITYNITVSNNGPSPAKDITITDPLPAGTTFSSLMSNLGTALICSTPPVGSNGTVSCLLNQLGRPGTALPSLGLISIVVNIGQSPPVLLSNTVAVSRAGVDPNPANNSSTATTTLFNVCVQDPNNGTILKFSSFTGDYQFINCRKGITLTGRGRVTINGCKITLTDTGPDPKRPDRNVQLSVNTCSKTGQGSVHIPSSGQTFAVNDSDITNNTCTCQ